MSELKIACPSCGGHIAFPMDMHGQVIPCPHCSLSVSLTVPGYSKPAPPPLPTPTTAPVYGKIKRKTEAAGTGCFVQGIGLLLILSGFFTFGITAVIGVVILIVGGRMAIKLSCSNCGNPVASKSVRLCPACNCVFR